MTIGWQLATPATRSVAIADTPGGAGGMGHAPVRPTKPAPAFESSSVPSQLPSALRSVAPSAAHPASGAPASMPATGKPSGTPSAAPTEVSDDPLPPLTMPPVPTPTDPDPDPTLSAFPSGSDLPLGIITFERRFRWSGHDCVRFPLLACGG